MAESSSSSQSPPAVPDVRQVLSEYRPMIDAALSKYLPHTVTTEADVNALCGPLGHGFAWDPNAITQGILSPAWELLNRGGKRWRPVLFLLIAEALGTPAADVVDFVSVAEVVHNGTLMVDDVEDQSLMRRGGPCTHVTHGADVAINAGNAMYFLPLTVLQEQGHRYAPEVLVRAYHVYAQEMVKLHLGQGTDILWHTGRSNGVPTEQQYLGMVACKTGTLARLAAKMSATLCGASQDTVEAIGRFAESIGVAFQIQDDILDVQGAFSEGKGQVGDDIREGKRTLMAIHAMTHDTGDGGVKGKRLEAILNMHTKDSALVEEAIGIIKDSGSIDYAAGVAKRVVQDAWSGVERLLPADTQPKAVAKAKLHAFATWLVERSI